MLLLSMLLIIHQICNYGRTVAAEGSQRCDDCIEYTLCPEAIAAVKIKTEQSSNLFKKGYCGFNVTPTGRIPKVCCSVFTTKEEKKPSFPTRIVVDLLPEECGPTDGNRILGGTVAGLYEFPWMALISYRTPEGPKFRCSGSIINSRYILTAAHCVHGNNIKGVRVGEHDIYSPVDCQEDSSHNLVCETHFQDIGVEEKIIHENYTHSILGLTNDIALLRVRKEINFKYQNVNKICLPKTEKLKNSFINGRIGTVTGWGFTETGRTSNVLLKVDMPILPDNECHNLYNRGIPAAKRSNVSNEFCAGGELGKDSCRGDSGGPLILEDEYNGALRYIQYGVVSLGPEQCGSTFAGKYTDVRKHMDWIIGNLKP